MSTQFKTARLEDFEIFRQALLEGAFLCRRGRHKKARARFLFNPFHKEPRKGNKEANMPKLLSQAISTGAHGRRKMVNDYFSAGLTSCCVLGAAMLAEFGASEVTRIFNGFPKSYGAILSNRLQKVFPIMFKTNEMVGKLYDQLVEFGVDGLQPKGEQGLAELIVLANDQSPMTHCEIAAFVALAEQSDASAMQLNAPAEVACQ